VDGTVWLAYRMRTPEGRGGRVELARGEEVVVTFDKSRFGAESLERPALVVTDVWRLYVSCATLGTKHWRIDLLEASTAEGLASASPRTVFPGDASWGVKDPVIRQLENGGWEGWVCCHPLGAAGEEDRMVTRYAVSPDGVSWTFLRDALAGRPGAWDARGARVTAVVGELAYYDGRATKEENFSERTGIARRAGDGTFVASDAEPIAHYRYLDVLPLPYGSRRLFYEAPRASGAHELRTELQQPPSR
jgi:hypothetical protein